MHRPAAACVLYGAEGSTHQAVSRASSRLAAGPYTNSMSPGVMLAVRAVKSCAPGGGAPVGPPAGAGYWGAGPSDGGGAHGGGVPRAGVAVSRARRYPTSAAASAHAHARVAGQLSAERPTTVPFALPRRLWRRGRVGTAVLGAAPRLQPLAVGMVLRQLRGADATRRGCGARRVRGAEVGARVKESSTAAKRGWLRHGQQHTRSAAVVVVVLHRQQQCERGSLSLRARAHTRVARQARPRRVAPPPAGTRCGVCCRARRSLVPALFGPALARTGPQQLSSSSHGAAGAAS